MKIMELIFYKTSSKYSKKCKIFEYHWIQKFSNYADLGKQDFLSQEKLSYRSRFVNKDVSQYKSQI